jgi:hypothetical protein
MAMMKRCKYAGIAAMLLLLIPAVVFQTNAQMPGMGGTSVSGKYVNSDFGIEIVFPEGWTGSEIPMEMFGVKTVMVAVVQDPNMMATGTGAMITLTFTKKIEGSDPLPPPTTSMSPEAECNGENQEVEINGISAVEHVMECTSVDPSGNPISAKMKYYDIETENIFLFVTYMGVPPSLYEEHAAKFEESLKTLKVASAAGSSSAVTVHHQSSTFDVMASLTNGMVDSITVDEDFTSIILELETSATDGELTIALPRALIDSKSGGANDEFIVVVDGDEVDYEETETTNTERTLMIMVPAGTEEIEIVGTQVVPEFPLAVMAVMGAIIATAIVMSRFKNPLRP